MAGNFITGEIDALFRDSMEKLVDDLGKRSTFSIVLPADFAECPNCIYDPVAKASSGKAQPGAAKAFTKVCPVCKGRGNVGKEKIRRIPSVIVNWSKVTQDVSNENQPTPPGELPFGYARCKMRVQFFNLVSSAESFIVDGLRCRIVGKPKKRGLKTFVIVEVLVRRDD